MKMATCNVSDFTAYVKTILTSNMFCAQHSIDGIYALIRLSSVQQDITTQNVLHWLRGL